MSARRACDAVPHVSGPTPSAESLASSALRDEMGSTSAETPKSRFALSCTNSTISCTSPWSRSMSALFSRNTTFFSHLRMYWRKLISDSESGRSALRTKRTRSARGTNSSVRRCWRSRMTFVPGVSTMLSSSSSLAGRKTSKWPSAARSRRCSSPYRNTLISFVVGRNPSLRKRWPSKPFTIEDLPELNSPHTTRRNGSSSCRTASRKSLSSDTSGMMRSSSTSTRPSISFSAVTICAPASFIRCALDGVVGACAGITAAGLASSGAASSSPAAPSSAVVNAFTTTPFFSSSVASAAAIPSETSAPSIPAVLAEAHARASQAPSIWSTSGMLTFGRTATRASQSQLTTRSAPSLAASDASASVAAKRHTSAPSSNPRRATTVGTSSSPKSTPSASAAAAMSGLPASSNRARPRRCCRSSHALAYSDLSPS
mmetsp:Transcript_17585/g.57462  ORF Transcript_17585/g.57462 Transcript_17585/m.57462 type:complete len:430 (+) Transcript_17585:2047-3336(+)